MNQAAGQETQLIAQRESIGMMATERNNEIATAAIAAASKAEVEAGFILAMKNPRDEETARIKILQVCKNPSFADKAIYSKPIGGTTVEGPSIRFVEEALRHWKHAKGIQISVLDDNEKLVFRQTVYDLEANLSFSEDITIRKTVERKKSDGRQIVGQRRNSNGEIVYIVQATEDEVNVKKSAAASKSIRNSGLRIIPEHIISEAMETCEAAIRAKVNKDPDAAKREIFDAFATLQVLPKDLEQYLGHPLAQVSTDEVANLRKVYQSIKDGHTKWSDYVAKTAAEPSAAPAVSFGKPKTAQPTENSPKPQETPKKNTSGIDAAFAQAKKSVVDKLGDKKGNEMISNIIGEMGYETYDEIPTEALRGEAMTKVLEKFQMIVDAEQKK